MKILFVDDERDVEALFRQKFRKEIKSGLLELAFASFGKEVLENLENVNKHKLDYVFFVINMAEMSDLELLEKIKNHFKNIQVNMISAYGDNEIYDKAMISVSNEFFTKPI